MMMESAGGPPPGAPPRGDGELQEDSGRKKGGLQILQQLGKWAICEDKNGRFFYDSELKELQLSPPEELMMELLGATQEAEKKKETQPQLLEVIGDWAVCEDPQGRLFFLHTETRELKRLPPEELAELFCAQKEAEEEKEKKRKPQLLEVISDWAVCEDRHGLFFIHTETKEAREEPPLEVLQILDQAEAKVKAKAQHSHLPFPQSKRAFEEEEEDEEDEEETTEFDEDDEAGLGEEDECSWEDEQEARRAALYYQRELLMQQQQQQQHMRQMMQMKQHQQQKMKKPHQAMKSLAPQTKSQRHAWEEEEEPRITRGRTRTRELDSKTQEEQYQVEVMHQQQQECYDRQLLLLKQQKALLLQAQQRQRPRQWQRQLGRAGQSRGAPYVE